jgi:hypothetical protein
VVILKVLDDPFIRANTAMAPFAPNEAENEKVGKYMRTVAQNVTNHFRGIGNEK